MEKRIGTALILIRNRKYSKEINEIISRHAEIILGRQGMPLRVAGYSLISLVFEGTTDQIGSLTGQLGKIPGVELKSVVLKTRPENGEV